MRRLPLLLIVLGAVVLVAGVTAMSIPAGLAVCGALTIAAGVDLMGEEAT